MVSLFTPPLWQDIRNISPETLTLTRMAFEPYGGITGYVPHVGEVRQAGIHLGRQHGFLSAAFSTAHQHLIRTLDNTPYPMYPWFRAYAEHLCNFPSGKAYKKQWNIGLTAGRTDAENLVRVGIGFRLSPQDTKYHDAISEYEDFRRLVRHNTRFFDQTFAALGNYCETEEQSQHWAGPLSAFVLNDDYILDAWRFFGRALHYDSATERRIIEDLHLFVTEVVRVFDYLAGTPFAA